MKMLHESNKVVLGLLLGLIVSCGQADKTNSIDGSTVTDQQVKKMASTPNVLADQSAVASYTKLVASLDAVTCDASNQNQLVYSEADSGFYYCSSSAQWTAINIQGQKGDTGAQGEIGATGAKGDTGAQGPSGSGASVVAVYSASPNKTVAPSITVNYASVTLFSDGAIFFTGEIIYYGAPYPMSFYIGSNKASTNVQTQLNLLIPGNNVLINTNNANAILSGLAATGTDSSTVVTIGTASAGTTNSSNMTAIGLTYQSGQ